MACHKAKAEKPRVFQPRSPVRAAHSRRAACVASPFRAAGSPPSHKLTLTLFKPGAAHKDRFGFCVNTSCQAVTCPSSQSTLEFRMHWTCRFMLQVDFTQYSTKKSCIKRTMQMFETHGGLLFTLNPKTPKTPKPPNPQTPKPPNPKP